VPYPKKLLNNNEEIALDLRPHWWYFSKHILYSGILIIFLVLVIEIHNRFTWIGWGILALIWAGWLAIRYFQWTNTHFVVTNQRVIFRTGALGKHGSEIPLDRVSNIHFHQGLWERIIGAGDLEIEAAGRDAQSKFDDVWHPDAVQQEIYHQMEARTERQKGTTSAPPQAATAPSAGAASVPEQLSQLAELRDRGVITSAEFEAKKAQLLDRM
jgi:uncharacterized membrane protein YdbT with pleckstrin-like domain